MIFAPQRLQNLLQLFSEAENAKLLNEDLYKTWVSSKLTNQAYSVSCQFFLVFYLFRYLRKFW